MRTHPKGDKARVHNVRRAVAARDDVIVMPTFYGGQHTENVAMIGAGRALDRSVFPDVSLHDNVEFIDAAPNELLA